MERFPRAPAAPRPAVRTVAPPSTRRPRGSPARAAARRVRRTTRSRRRTRSGSGRPRLGLEAGELLVDALLELRIEWSLRRARRPPRRGPPRPPPRPPPLPDRRAETRRADDQHAQRQEPRSEVETVLRRAREHL